MIKLLVERLSHLNTLYIVSLLFLITFICYANTLGNGLFFDDEQFIYKNQAVTSFDLGGFFSHSLTSGAGKLSNYYRPLLFMGFGIEYQLFQDSGFIYHLDSMLIHIAAGILIYLLLVKLFRDKLIATLTALLFLIHPIQTEAVAYASGRGDPLSFFFVLLALNFSLARNRKYQLLAVASTVCALLSKELALIIPGLIFLVHLFSREKITLTSFKKSLLATLPIAIITGLYFMLRITTLNFANTLNFYNSANVYSSNLFVRLNTFFHYFPSYLKLLVFPKELFMERDSNVTVYTTPTLQSAMSIISLIVLFGISLWRRKQAPIILFSLLWIGIAFIPTSGVIPINGIFYEHFLYYPSVGFFLLVAFVISKLYRLIPAYAKELLGIIVILGFTALGIRTIARNAEWHDPITFYTQTLSHVQSPRAYNNLAMAYAAEGKSKEAIQAYKRAIGLTDSYPESHYNLANSYVALNDLSDAEKEYKNALKLDPLFYLSYVSLYRVYKATDNKEGLNWVQLQLTQLGKRYPAFLDLLHQLQSE